MRFSFALLLILFSGVTLAQSLEPKDVVEVLFEKNIIGRDSGKEVTKEFLSSCIKSQNLNRYKLECDDVLFVHFISFFETDDKIRIILITEDGASVENRWVFRVQGNKYVDVKITTWPEITDSEISKLLIQQTNNKKYSPSFVSSVAHSSYRVQHAVSNLLKVLSGIPDETYGTELGVIKWNGNKFIFTPKGS